MATINNTGPSQTSTDLAQISNILSLVLAHIPATSTSSSNSFSHPSAAPVQPSNSNVIEHAPVCTPPHQTVSLPLGSPIHLTPTKLPRFLAHAENNLGVKNAVLLQSQMSSKGYGPDILQHIPDDKLRELGISDGDVIRLKCSAADWWNSPDAKRPKVEVEAAAKRNAQRKVRFERVWNDGRKTFYGPRIRAADFNEQVSCDYEDYFYCEAAESIMKIPAGFVAEEEAKEDEETDMFELL